MLPPCEWDGALIPVLIVWLLHLQQKCSRSWSYWINRFSRATPPFATVSASIWSSWSGSTSCSCPCLHGCEWLGLASLLLRYYPWAQEGPIWITSISYVSCLPQPHQQAGTPGPLFNILQSHASVLLPAVMLPVLVWWLVFLCKKMFISLSTVHDMPDKYVAIHQLAAVLHKHTYYYFQHCCSRSKL